MCLIHLCCIFLSRVAPAGAHFLANDFDSALRLVETELADKADQIWVIGGSSVYKVSHWTPRLVSLLLSSPNTSQLLYK